MFNVVCKLGFGVKLTQERYFHIISRHPEIVDKEDDIKHVLVEPNFIKRSKYDFNVLLFYKVKNEEYIVGVVKQEQNNGFVITAYITDFVKEGETVWKK